MWNLDNCWMWMYYRPGSGTIAPGPIYRSITKYDLMICFERSVADLGRAAYLKVFRANAYVVGVRGVNSLQFPKPNFSHLGILRQPEETHATLLSFVRVITPESDAVNHDLHAKTDE